MPGHAASRPIPALVTVLALLLSLVATLAIAPRAAAQSEFVAELSGAAEVPGPGDPDGAGFASVFVDPGAGQLCFFLEVQNIAPATAAHIHAGASGVAGPVVVTLTTPDAGGQADGCVDGVALATLQDIHDNPTNYYVNVHNDEFVAGAVRGQLGPAPIPLSAELSGAAEVPGPGDPDGSGFAGLGITVDAGEVCAFLEVFGIAPATAAHIHVGAAGVAGPVVVTLPTPDAAGFAEGCVDGLDPALLQAIVDDPAAYYVNVHNADYPAGAIRGQLSPPPITLFAGLDGASEVPGPGDPDGSAFASLDFFVGMGRVCTFIDASGIAAATAAHIHSGAAGVAGPIVVTLPTPDAAGTADGCVDGLDPALLQQIVDDPASFYVNVHTGDYPAGAIRGQLSVEPPPPPACQPGQLCNGIIGPGTYTYTGFGTDLTFTTVSDWFFLGDEIPSWNLFDLNEQAALFGFPFAGQVFADPCDLGSVATIGDSPAELMAWLGDRSFLDTTAPVAVSYGGASGFQVDLVATNVPAECTDPPLAFVFSLPKVEAFFFENGSTGRLVALDVAGETILFIVEHVAHEGEDPTAFMARAQAVLNSFDWALAAAPPPAGSPTPTPRPASGLPNTSAVLSSGAQPDAGVAVYLLGAGLALSAVGMGLRVRQSGRRR